QGFPVTAEAGPEEDDFNKQNNLTQNNILVANPVFYNLPSGNEGNVTIQSKALTLEQGRVNGIPGQEGSELQPLPGNIDKPGSAVEITRVSAGKEKPLEKLLGQESTPNLPNDQELQQAESRKNGTSVVPTQLVLNPKDEQQVDAGITRGKPSLSVDQLVETGDAGNQPNGDLSGGKQNLDRSAKKETVPQKEGFSPEVKLHYAQETIHSSAAKPVEQNNISFLNREVSVTHLPVRLTEMIRAMLVQQSAGETTLKMRLKPEQLGEVTVKLTWSKGELTAQFVTSSGMAKEALEASFPQLKEVLAQHNIRLGEAAVFVGQQSGQGNQHSFSQSQLWYTKGQGKYKGGYPGIQVQEEPTSTGHILNEDTGVNIVV
ncbi:MAG: flagellar hook-length control protein FliK, partial [Firmicutes bacterium]|nr:flagellar hook-length control protein FliK [Bacillota bacterium]